MYSKFSEWIKFIGRVSIKHKKIDANNFHKLILIIWENKFKFILPFEKTNISPLGTLFNLKGTHGALENGPNAKKCYKLLHTSRVPA